MDELQQLKNDVLIGLSKPNKYIPSKYFYDDNGSKLFNKITRDPEYYLTQCEVEILNSHKKELAKLLKNEPFNLLELGPGEGLKTQILIKQFIADSLLFSYYPIDISDKYLDKLKIKLTKKFPNLEVCPLNCDYTDGIKWLSSRSKHRNLILFLGSSIGNLDLKSTNYFLRNIRNALNNGDYVFIGFDLRKDINTLIHAYNDKNGITRQFNLNLLKRINNELNGDFRIKSFYHFANYDVQMAAMKSYLISLKEQTVHIKSLKKSFTFNQFEAIHVETSQKYLFSEINQLAEDNGFKIVSNYTDKQKYFINSLWEVRK